jgi:hypothetical protein
MLNPKNKKPSPFAALEEEFSRNLCEEQSEALEKNIESQDNEMTGNNLKSGEREIQKLRILHHHKETKLEKVTQALLDLLNEGLGDENEARIILHELPSMLDCSIGTVRSAVKRLQDAQIFSFAGQTSKLGVVVKRLKKVKIMY